MAVYARAATLGIRRSTKIRPVSYKVRIIRTEDNSIFYGKNISSAGKPRERCRETVRLWSKMFAEKLESGEWYLSIINGFDSY